MTDEAHAHSWVSLPKPMSGVTHIEKCSTCDARHISGSPVCVLPDGTTGPA